MRRWWESPGQSGRARAAGCCSPVLEAVPGVNVADPALFALPEAAAAAAHFVRDAVDMKELGVGVEVDGGGNSAAGMGLIRYLKSQQQRCSASAGNQVSPPTAGSGAVQARHFPLVLLVGMLSCNESCWLLPERCLR